LRKVFWGMHFGARGYLAGTITDEVVREYIEGQEGEPVHDDSQFQLTIREATAYRRWLTLLWHCLVTTPSLLEKPATGALGRQRKCAR
jgi:hypothetical protein